MSGAPGTILLLGLLLPAAALADDRCPRAVDHLKKIMEREIVEAGSKISAKDAVEIRRQLQDRTYPWFHALCDSGELDVDCALAAKTERTFRACLRFKPKPPRPAPADRARQVELLRRLDATAAKDRLSALGAVLRDAAIYPERFDAVLKTLAEMGPDFAALELGTSSPCDSETLIAAVEAAPQAGARIVLERCQSGATRIDGPGLKTGGAQGMAGLAILLQRAAVDGGFADSPLHRHAVALLLGRD